MKGTASIPIYPGRNYNHVLGWNSYLELELYTRYTNRFKYCPVPYEVMSTISVRQPQVLEYITRRITQLVLVKP